MSTEEQIAVECVLRAYEDMYILLKEQKDNPNSKNVYFPDERESKARGKIDGAKEVLRDLIRMKI
jgi:hypothetical protein